jgi:hypothetical protein
MTKISILPFIVLAGMLSGGNATNCYDFKKPTECENTSGCRWVDKYDHYSPPGQARHGYCGDDFWIRSQKTKRSLETDSDYDNEGADVERINSNNQDLLAEYKDEEDELPNKAVNVSTGMVAVAVVVGHLAVAAVMNN